MKECNAYPSLGVHWVQREERLPAGMIPNLAKREHIDAEKAGDSVVLGLSNEVLRL